MPLDFEPFPPLHSFVFRSESDPDIDSDPDSDPDPAARLSSPRKRGSSFVAPCEGPLPVSIRDVVHTRIPAFAGMTVLVEMTEECLDFDFDSDSDLDSDPDRVGRDQNSTVRP
jgi:hypothetical protein